MYETGPSGPFLPFSLTWIKPRKPSVFSVTGAQLAARPVPSQAEVQARKPLSLHYRFIFKSSYSRYLPCGLKQKARLRLRRLR